MYVADYLLHTWMSYSKDNILCGTRFHNVVYFISGTIPEIIMTFILGSYTDKVGRKKILFFPIIGNFLKVVVTLFIIWFKWPLSTIAVISTVAGMFGGSTCLFSICYAYIVDITDEKERSFRYVYLYFTKTIKLKSYNVTPPI